MVPAPAAEPVTPLLGGEPLAVDVGGGVTLRGEAAGPADGPLLVLLHGFPEGRWGWRHQFAPLAAAGFRVLAPDQRGYGDADKPRRVADYRIERLVADVLAVIEAQGRDRAALVGHDWGAAVAWCAALLHPQRVERLAILNVPHPAVMRRHLSRDPLQMLRSWYVALFQLPWLPEALNRLGGGALPAALLRRSARPGTFDHATLAPYRRAWSRPGAWEGMLAWYRAAVRHPPRLPAGKVVPPTLLLWGARDRFLREAMAAESLAHCADGRLVLLRQATHWLQHEEPQRVNAELEAFLA